MSECQYTAIPGERLVQPYLLLLLCRKPGHGYELIQRLSKADFTGGEVDPATVYRHLRRMEQEGLVGSRWEAGPAGPARRLYEVSARGRELLASWSEAIASQKEKLENFLAEYRQIKQLS
ncbi:PadR family transcriptional regulator [Desulfotomaculum copahuensis]|nr:helix-turn-helix transcriptional regulator [Desulfotomaculum copahuensis]